MIEIRDATIKKMGKHLVVMIPNKIIKRENIREGQKFEIIVTKKYK